MGGENTEYGADQIQILEGLEADIYYDKKRDWNKIVERAMEQDFSWKNSAKQYETLYKELIGE